LTISLLRDKVIVITLFDERTTAFISVGVVTVFCVHLRLHWSLSTWNMLLFWL